MINNILFPTDFSAAANKAFIYALQIADRFEATLFTLHVYQTPDIHGSHISIILRDMLRDVDLVEFENYRDSLPPLEKIIIEKGFAHLDIKHILEEGPVLDNILSVSKRDAIDLIVMGTTGARGLKELLVGSIAGEVLEHANCPVLAVPEKANFDGNIDRIAFTTNYQEDELQALEIVRNIARPFDAEVYCINVDLPHTEFHNRRMEKLIEEYAGQENIYFEVLDGIDIREAITKYLKQENIDILSMITHKRNFLQELFHYSKTKAMSYHSEIPVLSVPAHILDT